MPLSNFPDKLLLVIFFLCFENVTVIPPPQSDTRNSLAQVCQQWRRLMLATPTIWQNAVFSPIPFQRPINLLRLAKLWLRRSQGALLSLNFCADTRSAMPAGQLPTSAQQLMYGGGAFNIVKSIILPCASRIRSLTCIICTKSVIKSFLKIPLGTLGALESVEITFLNDFVYRLTPFTQEENSSFTVFQSLPNLRRAIFHIFNGIHPLDLQLPWNNLAIIDLGSTAMSPDVFMTIIHFSTHSLTEGFFQIDFTTYIYLDHPLAQEIPHAEARQLQRLRLRLIDPGNDHRIFSLLQLPSIRELRVELHDPSRGWEMSIFTSMLEKSATTLQVLMFSDLPPPTVPDGAPPAPRRPQRDMSYTELEELFKTVPNLRALHLPLGLFIHAPTMEMIACGQLLPLLVTLKLSSLSGVRVPFAVVTRNALAKYNLRGLGTSDLAPRSLAAISYVFIMVPHQDEQVLKDQVAVLQGLGYLMDVEFNIVGGDLNCFKK
ncbi:hypothetical protein BDZ97DRAFT_1763958 [Flammula alnicola]|nr:hypothetical protein BDZ97DRAFT_1763958 [Flammula alnicola]